MFPDDYSPEDFERDFNQLLEEGLIEVVGINEKGQWLYSATEEGKRFYELLTRGAILEQFESKKDVDDQ